MWSIPISTSAPSNLNFCICSLVNLKCKNWTEEALPSAEVLSTSCSGIAFTIYPSIFIKIFSSIPPTLPKKAALETGLSISNINVAINSFPLGIKGL